MSGYWDALLGAALGLPGTARPGPGPRLLAAGEDDGLPIELEALHDAPRAPPPAPSAPARTTPLAEVRPEAVSEPEPLPPRLPAPTAPSPRPSEPAPWAAAAEPIAVERRVEAVPPLAQAAVERPGPAAATPQPVASEPPAVEATRAVPLKVVEPPPAQVAPALPLPVEERPAETAAESSRTEPMPVAPTTVAAEPLATPAAWSEKEEERPAPPLLTVEIGRIDVRIVAPEPAPSLRPSPKRASDLVPSLADYLARRGETGR